MKTKEQKQDYQYNKALAPAIFKYAFNRMSKKTPGMGVGTEIDNCIGKIMSKNNESSSAHELWKLLTQKVKVYESVVERKWLVDFTEKNRIDGCDVILKNGLLTDEEIKKKDIGKISTQLRKFIDAKLLEAGKKSEKRMRKFMTSSVSTYKGDKNVSKHVYNRLNGGGRRGRKRSNNILGLN
eukprot:CAMPEP_0170526792 /NCGR_PEP_ID=MMETSP0209-20121228/12199_1 /TAXON_ID=665100 ORGANISM="Litonotus pictus, Strain P1" /NCGR_SAMPLE_ID=MMETSP0209 /ASSEMBLY_ACC=CAM_ASM_000301 /LENGTH=181 /DNA_ID=CAMNT_0010816837 /DNA_START=83 /DNA_END=631 /DNA_ORIENTATION=-